MTTLKRRRDSGKAGDLKKTIVSIIGIGLLGGSLARALQKRGGSRVVGWSPSRKTRQKASAFMTVRPTLEGAILNSDVIVIGSPSAQVVPLLKQILPRVKPGTLIMDMASVKGTIVQEAQRVTGALTHFVPCHPMTGKEKSGVGYSDPTLYVGKKIFITPMAKTQGPLLIAAMNFWKKVGGIPHVMKAGDHDRRVAMTSHVPHLMACALIECFGAEVRKDPATRDAVGSGFKDMTRIAASSPGMWVDIVEMNEREIKGRLTILMKILSRMKKDLGAGRRKKWEQFFSKVRELREKL